MNKVIAIVCHQVTTPLVHTVNYFSSYAGNIILLHIDQKSNIEDFLFLQKDNVIILTQRIDVRWGGVSQIRATHSLMTKSLDWDYSHFFLISGDDIPIATNDEIDSLIQDNIHVDFIHYQDSRNEYVNPVERVKYNYPEAFYVRKPSFKEKLIRFFHGKTRDYFFLNKYYLENPSFPKLYKGTNWFGLTRGSISYITNFLNGNDTFYKVFSRSLCADEVFFHTILKTKNDVEIYQNPDAINNALRYIDWVTGPEFPKILDQTDFEKIISSKALFARKIKLDASREFMQSFLSRK